MCGIAGLVDWGGRPAAQMDAVVARMQAAVAHRGPDGTGRVRRGAAGSHATAYLAHQRLAIIDLSDAGRQPMASHAGTHWITYNGEIYNYQTLRSDAALMGTPWRSMSDTEVLVEGLARHGTAWLERLRGMFALACWNDANGELILARDRFGIKPLVWAQPAPDLLLFASTPQALAASGLVTLVPMEGIDSEFLARGSVPRDSSGWRGVSVVPAGHVLSCDAHGPRVTRWAPVTEWARQAPGERPAAVVGSEIRAAVLDSVRAHFVSDVPVALFLSGGRDSVALLAAARALQDVPLRTFTVTMPGSPLDEGRQARVAAEYFGAEHTELAVDSLDLDEALDAFFAAMAQPSVDGFNTFLVARAATRAGIRVALSGVGGDELFGGYPSFTDVPRLQRALGVLGPALRAAGPLLARGPSERAAKLAAIAGAAPRSTAEVWWEYRGLWSRPDVQTLAGTRAPEMREASCLEGHPFDVIRGCEWHEFLERQLLPDADAFTMCHALELRTPFVDPTLVDAVRAAGRWPRGAYPTYKQALFVTWDDMTVPALRDDPKQGFVLPFASWLRQALGAPQPAHWADVARRLRVPRYQPYVDRFMAGRLHWSRLWALYVRERMGQ